MIHSRIGVGGIKVGFRVDATPYNAFKTVLADFGLGKYCPNPRTDYSALVATMSSKHGGKDRMVKGKKHAKKNGVEVVKTEKHDVTPNDYTTEIQAKVLDREVVIDGYADDELTEEFLRTKAVLTTSAVNEKLNEILAKEMLGQRGLTGTYIPEVYVPAWKALAERLFGAYDHDGCLIAEGICGGEYEVSTVDLDADTIRSIRARLAAEVKKEAERISWDVLKGTLNAEQVTTRCEDCQALLKKLEVYEQEFRLGLDDLKEAAERANQFAAAALMAELTGAGVGL